MAPGMQKWGHPDHALMLVSSYYEHSGVLCLSNAWRGESGNVPMQTPYCLGGLFVYYSLTLKFFHLESFAFTLKMDVERFSETSEFEV